MEEYKSPRITSEVLECSMPLTFDQYSNCGFNCAYCFSQYIRGVGPGKSNYDRLSKAIGFDIFEFYRQFKGKFAGYVRLDYKIKKVWADRFVALCHKYNVKPFFSDVDFKHYCEGSGSCCGILDSNE